MFRNVTRLALLVVGLLIASTLGCGSGGGDSDGTTLRVGLTDAKPALPDGVDGVTLTIGEVSVHREGGSWISLPLARSPYVVDLLQFQGGKTTDLVPPAELEPGRYTQLRLSVLSAAIRVSGHDLPLEVPSDFVRTDKNFDLADGGAVDLTVDFDLSRSLVATGSGNYKLKPVLHLVETARAARINGIIAGSAFGTATEAVVSMSWDADRSGGASAGDEEYTRVVVPKGSQSPAEFSIFWLVPGEGYLVEVEIQGAKVYQEFVPAAALPPGASFALNGGTPIGANP